MFRFKPYCLADTHLVPSLNKHKGKWGNMALLLGSKNYTHVMPFSNTNLHFFRWKIFYKENNGNIWICILVLCLNLLPLSSLWPSLTFGKCVSFLISDWSLLSLISHLNPLVIKVDPLWLFTELFLSFICRTCSVWDWKC